MNATPTFLAVDVGGTNVPSANLAGIGNSIW